MATNLDIVLSLTLTYQTQRFPLNIPLTKCITDETKKRRSLYFRSVQKHPAKAGESLCIQAAITPAETAEEINDIQALEILKSLLG